MIIFDMCYLLRVRKTGQEREPSNEGSQHLLTNNQLASQRVPLSLISR